MSKRKIIETYKLIVLKFITLFNFLLFLPSLKYRNTAIASYLKDSGNPYLKKLISKFSFINRQTKGYLLPAVSISLQFLILKLCLTKTKVHRVRRTSVTTSANND